jgi:hypothetical protein
MKTHFPNPEDLLNFELTIQPDEGACQARIHQHEIPRLSR